MDSQRSWALIVELFNAGRYIECVVPLETFWFAGRDDFYKALIRVCVALNQLKLGLITSPRGLLETAHTMLAPYTPIYESIDVQALREQLAHCLAVIPPNLETGQGRVPLELVPTVFLPLAGTLEVPPALSSDE